LNYFLQTIQFLLREKSIYDVSCKNNLCFQQLLSAMPVDFSMDTAEKRPQGYLVSRRTALALLAAACAVIVLTAVVTHNLSNCGKSNGDHSVLTNVLKQPAQAQTKVRDVRLPRSVVPDSYQVRLVPHLWGENSNFTFSGQITIRVNVTEDTDNVTLHANALTVK
jgi:hypothetical protein